MVTTTFDGSLGATGTIATTTPNGDLDFTGGIDATTLHTDPALARSKYPATVDAALFDTAEDEPTDLDAWLESSDNESAIVDATLVDAPIKIETNSFAALYLT